MARVGVDVGGTHIDFVLIDDKRGEMVVHKVPTPAGDPSTGAMEGLLELCRQAAIAPGEIDYFMHGTTIATNIVLEHNGAKCGLITTEGFRDLLHIARHKRPHNFSLQLDLPWQKHELVPRRARKTVRERIAGGDSAVLVPLDEDAVRRAARELRAAGVESIAVCFLFSFLNPSHERRAADIGVAPGGEIRFKHLLDTRIGAYHAMVPMAEVDTIGAGGGSIAYVDSGGQFQVGPRSAGADPGPCCYGKGGGEPTATDCELVLGRIDPAGFLGGRLQLRAALAHRAGEAKLARPLALTVEAAAPA